MMEERKDIFIQVVVFLVVTTVLTIGVFVWMFMKAKGSETPRYDVGLAFLMMWTPAISAFITSLILRDSIREYGWRPGKLRYLGYAYVLPIVASIVAYGLVWMTGLADITLEGTRNYRWARMLGLQTPVPVVVGLLSKIFLGFILGFVFALGEEIGWSGFLTPKLSKISSVTVTSLIVGGYWAVWHYPAIIGGMYGYNTPLWVSLPGFTMVIIAASFIRTVLRLKSKSMWVGAVLHTSHNLYLMGIFRDITVKEGYADWWVSETGLFMGVVYLVVAIVFWKWQMRPAASAG
jgi:membrane protease YdiL (CAAX protease family)